MVYTHFPFSLFIAIMIFLSTSARLLWRGSKVHGHFFLVTFIEFTQISVIWCGFESPAHHIAPFEFGFVSNSNKKHWHWCSSAINNVKNIRVETNDRPSNTFQVIKSIFSWTHSQQHTRCTQLKSETKQQQQQKTQSVHERIRSIGALAFKLSTKIQANKYTKKYE